ncbi:DotD/TraH family lipoprotein [Acidithiobacillus thiooxidans]|uniref:DotD/TraH family lipoprotein n=1 Tax=Acidithiobacillus thiooxidans TaxID=930 RepID=UPI001C0676DF|nr:DotD/TraH family lipoprotein [Acidithiobacillus thiooxidans]MBU2752329.1 DotD/TraH family lipoprotein [Acidithiobacillus thiooxidans]
MSLKKSSVLMATLTTAALSGCAAQVPPAQTTVTPLPAVLLRASHQAAQAQQRVSEVLYVQSHPAVIGVAPSPQRAMLNRIHFHWSGPLDKVGLNLASAMGWSFSRPDPQPAVQPEIYLNAKDVRPAELVRQVNREAMPVALLLLNPHTRSVVEKIPSRAEMADFSMQRCAPRKVTQKRVAHSAFHTPKAWFENAKK